MNALVAGSGSYIVRLSVRDLHGPTITTLANSALLPPAFQRNGGGTVFTGVCLSTF